MLPPRADLPPSDPCPCGMGRTYAACCAAYVVDGQPAPSAVALMRSRYTAYAVGALDHVVRTWHPRTRPADLTLDPGLRWTGLRILDAAGGEGGGGDDVGEVEFVASWESRGERGSLHERSRFARRGGRWLYVDGDTR